MSPVYYASGEIVREFVLEGMYFDYLPDSAVGVLAYDNDNPLEMRDTQLASQLFDIVEKTDTQVRFVARTLTNHPRSSYFGGIVSADRSVVYWENNTKPLP